MFRHSTDADTLTDTSHLESAQDRAGPILFAAKRSLLAQSQPAQSQSADSASAPTDPSKPATSPAASASPVVNAAPTKDPEGRPTIVLADDHPIFLEGLKRLLSTEFDVVGMASSGEKLVQLVAELSPDLVVTDYSMPGLTGVQAVQSIRDAGQSCRVVMMTMHEDVEYALEALELGIEGYVLKRAASSELISAITGALEGDRWISPALAVDIISATAGMAGSRARANGGSDPSPLDKISSRQRHILEGLVQGKIAKEIAGELELSRKTVEYHKYKMMDQLGVKSTAELIRLAVRFGVAG